MASINDVYNQLVTVNVGLAAIGADVNAGTTATNNVKSSVDQLDTDLKTGFAQNNQALIAIEALDVEAVKLLFHLSQQTDAMICALERISQNTCALLTQSVVQTALQTRMADDLDALMAIGQSAYPAAALESERLAALRAEVHRCCPPEQPAPACTYEPCPKPRPAPEPKLPKPPKSYQPR